MNDEVKSKKFNTIDINTTGNMSARG